MQIVNLRPFTDYPFIYDKAWKILSLSNIAQELYSNVCDASLFAIFFFFILNDTERTI